MTYKDALELNETVNGLDLSDLELPELLAIIDELPGWDYPLAEKLLREMSSRAGVDYDQYFSERDGQADCNDLWVAAAEKLGVEI